MNRANDQPTDGKNAPDQEDLATMVRSRRKAAKLTQRDLASLVGVGTRVISELENGKPTLRMDVVNRVLNAFGKRLGAIDQLRTDS